MINDMKSGLRKKVCVLVLICYTLLPCNSFAQDATLTNFIVTNTRDDLLVYLTVEGAFTEKMRKAILSGVPTTFSFFIQLNRVRNFWPDKEIVEIDVTHTIKYNNLKKEFVITRSWESNQPIVTKSFGEARKLMSEIDSLKAVPLNLLEKGSQYQIRAKAQLSKLTLPFYLHYVLFFVSLWDFETDWYTVDFIY
jgi:hypothetical protein